MRSILTLFFLAALVWAWTCPSCGTENTAEFCSECSLPFPPEGMEYVEATTVIIDGEEVEVEGFFIDSSPVTYRETLDWLAGEIRYVHDVHVYISGQEDLMMPGDAMGEQYSGIVFMRYSPWVIYTEDQTTVSGFTVQTGCFDIPAASLTWQAARLYLGDRGAFLPTRSQMVAATRAGVIDVYDTWEAMSAYSDFIAMTLSGILGTTPAGLSMFADSDDPSERVMWEWTRDAWGTDPDALPDGDSPYALLFKPLDPPVVGTGLRSSGYYNVIFRGVVNMPWRE